jgi:hypothetical protein
MQRKSLIRNDVQFKLLPANAKGNLLPLDRHMGRFHVVSTAPDLRFSPLFVPEKRVVTV